MKNATNQKKRIRSVFLKGATSQTKLKVKETADCIAQTASFCTLNRNLKAYHFAVA